MEKIEVEEFHFYRWICPECGFENEDDFTPADEDGQFCGNCQKRFYGTDFNPNFKQM